MLERDTPPLKGTKKGAVSSSKQRRVRGVLVLNKWARKTRTWLPDGLVFDYLERHSMGGTCTTPEILISYFRWQDEATITVNMTAEDLQTKYDGNLNSEMVGPLHNLIAKVRHFVGREHQLV